MIPRLPGRVDINRMPLPHLPVLRLGRPYESLDKTTITSLGNGAPLAEVSQANAGILRRDAKGFKAARESLRKVTTQEMVEICARAAEMFLNGTLPLGEGTEQSAQAYVETLSATSGLPHVLCRRNMQKIHYVLANMKSILDGLTRGLNFDVLDHGLGEQAGVGVCYHAVTDALGVVLPSNSPGVNSIWLPAVALRIPVILKPGREEPWTPFRIIQALIKAGCPAEAFGFYPTDHEGAGVILRACGRALLFGDAATTAPYAANPGVQIHGPGRSKVLIGEDQADAWREHIELLVASVAANGGRSCINASAILTPRHAAEVADALAQALAEITPRDAADEAALLPGFANPQVAEAIDAAIEAGLQTPGAEDLCARHRQGPRLVKRNGISYLMPTVILCDSMEHPLANREYLFPFVSVIAMPQAEMLPAIGPSLVVTALSTDEAWTRELIDSESIDRLNLGPVPTSHVEWDQPHEGNLFEFLYRRRAIQLAPSAALPR